jgi:hypothetical protein
MKNANTGNRSSERRPLIDGLNAIPVEAEKQFVYGEKATSVHANASSPATSMSFHSRSVPVARVPLTSRVRADIAEALKRASLERQLQRIEPSSVQEILENALEPWLKANGYLT